MLRQLRTALDPRRVSALYLLGITVIVFAVWIPGLFLSLTTLRSVLAQMGIDGILAVGLVLPLAAGIYDLAVGWTLGLSATVLSVLVLNAHFSPAAAIAICLLVGVAIGITHSIAIVTFRVDSFIATLGSGSILSGLVFLLSNNQDQFGLPSSITKLAGNGPFGISLVFYILLAISVIIWFVLEHTPAGRYTRATGGNPMAARLAGVRTTRYIVLALLVSGVMASIAGILYAAQVSGTDPSVGGTYLLPAFSAALFGATQIRPGHPNVWGTLLALFALTVGSTGFNLVGVNFWITDVFFGFALVAAVALRQWEGRTGQNAWKRRLKPPTDVTPSSSNGTVADDVARERVGDVS